MRVELGLAVEAHRASTGYGSGIVRRPAPPAGRPRPRRRPRPRCRSASTSRRSSSDAGSRSRCRRAGRARRSTPAPARSPRRRARAASSPCLERSCEYISPCWEETLAVVWPVTPWPIRPASISTTRTPASCSSSAVVTPTMPPPITATSAVDVTVEARDAPAPAAPSRARASPSPQRQLLEAHQRLRVADPGRDLQQRVEARAAGTARRGPPRSPPHVPPSTGVMRRITFAVPIGRPFARRRRYRGAYGLDHLGVVLERQRPEADRVVQLACRERGTRARRRGCAWNRRPSSRSSAGSARASHTACGGTDMNLRLVATVPALPRERGANLAVRPMTRARRERAKLGSASSMRGLILPGCVPPPLGHVVAGGGGAQSRGSGRRADPRAVRRPCVRRPERGARDARRR